MWREMQRLRPNDCETDGDNIWKVHRCTICDGESVQFRHKSVVGDTTMVQAVNLPSQASCGGIGTSFT